MLKIKSKNIFNQAKELGSVITGAVASVATNAAASAAKHGNKDLADALRPAANAATTADFHGKTEVIKLKNDFAALEKTVNEQSAQIEKNATEATEQTKTVLADHRKLESATSLSISLSISTTAVATSASLSTDAADPMPTRIIFGVDKTTRNDVMALSTAVTDIKPVKTTDPNAESDQNPVHLRGIISNAPERSKDAKTGLEDPKKAMDIANGALKKMTKLAEDTKAAFEKSNAAFAELQTEIAALQKEITDVRATMHQSVYIATMATKMIRKTNEKRIEKEKKAAEAAKREAEEKAKKEAEEKAKREVEEKAKKANEIKARFEALRKQLVAQQAAELDALNNPNAVIPVSASASASVNVASAAVPPKPITPAMNAANAASKESEADADYSNEGQPGAVSANSPSAASSAHKPTAAPAAS